MYSNMHVMRRQPQEENKVELRTRSISIRTNKHYEDILNRLSKRLKRSKTNTIEVALEALEESEKRKARGEFDS